MSQIEGGNMPTAPLRSTYPTTTHGPVLVVHPKVAPENAELAGRASYTKLNAFVLTFCAVIIWVVAIFFVAIDHPQAASAYGVAGLAALAYWVAMAKVVVKPWRTRNRLLREGKAFWLDPGPTKQFYDEQRIRILAWVLEHHRHNLQVILYGAVQVMQRIDAIKGGEAPVECVDGLAEGETYETRYANVTAKVLKQIEQYTPFSE